MATISLPQVSTDTGRPNIERYDGDLEQDAALFKTIKSCNSVIGSLSNPSKMPGWSTSLPASMCRTGSKLSKIPGTVCFGCYAADDWGWLNQPGRKSRYSNYAFPAVRDSLRKRLDALADPKWVPAMVSMIRKRCDKDTPFRWHDSGDIQSLEHLENICAVCEATPDVKHWIPTREYHDVDAYLEKHGKEPDNLAIRVSAHRVNQRAPKRFELTSMVIDGFGLGVIRAPDDVFECPAYKQGGKCGECRACWDKTIPTTVYPLH
mgnify:CR=1 FL=1